VSEDIIFVNKEREIWLKVNPVVLQEDRHLKRKWKDFEEQVTSPYDDKQIELFNLFQRKLKMDNILLDPNFRRPLMKELAQKKDDYNTHLRILMNTFKSDEVEIVEEEKDEEVDYNEEDILEDEVKMFDAWSEEIKQKLLNKYLSRINANHVYVKSRNGTTRLWLNFGTARLDTTGVLI
jgi:hypothetical protein